MPALRPVTELWRAECQEVEVGIIHLIFFYVVWKNNFILVFYPWLSNMVRTASEDEGQDLQAWSHQWPNGL